MRYLVPFTILTMLVAAGLQAQTPSGPNVTISWTVPTSNVDGSTPAAFEGFNLYRGTALPLTLGKTPGPIAGGATNPISAKTLSYTDKNVPPGTYYYAITAWHCETAGCTESVATVSGAVTVKATPKTSTAPGSITVTVNGIQAPN